MDTPGPAQLLEHVAAVLGAHRDVVEGRVEEPSPPDWCRRRGWSEWLLALDDSALLALESGQGELPGPAPAALVALCRSGRALDDGAAEASVPDPRAAAVRELRGASPRKAGQVAALVAAVRLRFGDVRRVVDVGSGLGHLARALGRELGVEVLGLEREPARVRRARELAGDAARFHCSTLGAPVDGEGHAGLDVGAGDLLTGLHACGSLGDDLVRTATRHGAHALLVGCCLQKLDGDARRPLSRRGAALDLRWSRAVLGLTNLVARSRCVAGPAREVMALRGRRQALRVLLRERGVAGEVGAEMRGLDRRHVVRGLECAARRALERRGLPAPTALELGHATEVGSREFAVMRRLSLPRLWLGRLLERSVVLDRACALDEAGHAVVVEPLFAPELSPRNLGIAARGPGAARV